ncbi:hypothetical protein [Bradyrhizobium valentinum]|uniref:hypothetical protein n=1 Tax=Bradyrhizobium valentinum TaxID=1518501 RepID=UPI0007108404|nr:hypothetical protein [Bradyrhizobium valentinum]
MIAANAKNRIVLSGKARTVFSSAFMARAPILPENIRAVDVVKADDYVQPNVDLSFLSITTFAV